MFDIGMAELIIVCVLGLLVVGPERLPTVARNVGRWIGGARRMAASLKNELEREVLMQEFDEANKTKATGKKG